MKTKENKKEINGLNDIWTYNDVPKEGEFVLIANAPYMDNATTMGQSTDKEELIKKGKAMIPNIPSFLRIYNHEKKIVWDALLPTTMPPEESEYDPEYFLKEIKKSSWYHEDIQTRMSWYAAHFFYANTSPIFSSRYLFSPGNHSSLG